MLNCFCFSQWQNQRISSLHQRCRELHVRNRTLLSRCPPTVHFIRLWTTWRNWPQETLLVKNFRRWRRSVARPRRINWEHFIRKRNVLLRVDQTWRASWKQHHGVSCETKGWGGRERWWAGWWDEVEWRRFDGLWESESVHWQWMGSGYCKAIDCRGALSYGKILISHNFVNLKSFLPKLCLLPVWKAVKDKFGVRVRQTQKW